MTGVSDRLERMVRQVQAQGRVPAVSAALHRVDRPAWSCAVGGTGNDAELSPETPFRIGSVTKTFTSVLVLQCRDAGLVDLDDPVGRHLDLPAHGELTVRRLLSHTAGLQREPYGDVWDTLRAPDTDQLVADLARAERVLAPARRYHYSNLGMALLGQLVGRLRGGTWPRCSPSGCSDRSALTATSVTPADAATGFLVDAYSDEAIRSRRPTSARSDRPRSSGAPRRTWPAGRRSSPTRRPGSVGRRARPGHPGRDALASTVTDETLWGGGFGLGLILVRRATGDARGNDGAMPGFLAAVYGRRGGDGTAGAMGCAVLGSSGTGVEVMDLPHRLLAASAEHDPADIEPWRPGEPAPERYRGMLGRWWGEGFEYVFGWHDGALRARGAGDPAGKPPAVFAPLPDRPDVFRTVSGREAGELLRLTRDERGVVVRMHWATYRFTRVQETFDGYDFRADG
jgi:CubicO group peptidase (beta-lactamase class C family)